MRTYGRTFDGNGDPTGWTEITTDTDGSNDYVWIATLIQCLRLMLGESPFWANYGLPGRQSVVSQVAPDLYVTITQQQFAPYFASLVISKQTTPVPTYTVDIVTNQGVRIPSFVVNGAIPS
jgi:hypothetical protein